MLSVMEEKSDAWTKQALGQAIGAYKDQGDHGGLGRFLEARLVDVDPCLEPLKAGFLNELGLVRIEQEAFEEACDCFERALEIEAGHTAARYNLATIAMEHGELDVALKGFDAVLAQEPDHFDALFNAGLCRAYAGNRDGALSFFKRAASLRPEEGRVQYLTGETLLQSGRAAEALPFFRAAHGRNHGHFETTMGLAAALLETRRHEEAVVVCDRALITFGPAVLPLQIKGDAVIAMDRIAEAAECHMDLCRMDLDVRDFVVARVQKLSRENPVAFDAYVEVVQEDYPDLEALVGTIPQQKKISGCSGNRCQKGGEHPCP